MDIQQKIFFSLVKSGLWESDVYLPSCEENDYREVFKLASEQSVIGIVTAGLEHAHSSNILKENLLLFIGATFQIEKRNKELNNFIREITNKMEASCISSLIVKGQGIAQCYERPLWRSSGDVDFLFDENNFLKARDFFRPLVTSYDPDDDYSRHLSGTVGEWDIELHGNQRTMLSLKIDEVIDDIQEKAIENRRYRVWQNEQTNVLLPNPDDDVIYVFTHYLKHFFKGGIGLRQICDWCRLLYTYKDSINYELLESRIRKMGLLTEWKAFGAFAVDYLGMPSEAMPLYAPDKKWSRKGDRICAFVMEVGNFGHNRDNGYYAKYPFLIRKTYSFGRRCGDLIRHARIFPLDSLRFFPYMMYNGIRAALKGIHND